MKNAITIDLEDYYQVSAFANDVLPGNWESYASRIENNTAKLLDIFDATGRKATFFTLGWVAKRYPKLVREIATRGHEIACHSNEHRLVYAMEPREFREDTSKAMQLLEEASGTAVRGYRAPSFSIRRTSLWAFEILAELGFRYDSSIFPIRHANYGMPRSPRFPFTIQTANGPIVEFPMPTLEMAGARAPLGGGAYLRLLPYWYTRWGIRFINTKENRAACVYLHPWELDSEQPRMSGSLTARLRHYVGLRGTESKFRRLLHDFEFQPLGSLIRELESGSSQPPQEQFPKVLTADLGLYLAEG